MRSSIKFSYFSDSSYTWSENKLQYFMQDFSGGGVDFSRVKRNFTIGQSLKIWGNFSKICIKINKQLKNIEKIREKCKFLRKFINFQVGDNF